MGANGSNVPRASGSKGRPGGQISFLPNLFLVKNERQAGASPSQKKESRRPCLYLRTWLKYTLYNLLRLNKNRHGDAHFDSS